ncbi:type II toxin-antitoxin system RelE/ParE family toxin [Phytobacter sp. V91]|uniref:type II toxin-antitoxin system RelE/ParE family toxin n=1 Tax=Phytobacter sp. V91 TaxID=3369425 RepID=UPI003F638F6B
MREIELTPKANEDLESIWLYGFEMFGMEKADRYILHLSSVFGHIAQHRAGRRREELGQDIRSFPSRQHVIFYKEDEQAIIVIRVLHHSQDVETHLYWQ